MKQTKSNREPKNLTLNLKSKTLNPTPPPPTIYIFSVLFGTKPRLNLCYFGIFLKKLLTFVTEMEWCRLRYSNMKQTQKYKQTCLQILHRHCSSSISYVRLTLSCINRKIEIVREEKLSTYLINGIINIQIQLLLDVFDFSHPLLG